jgi:hypothetical protein
MRRESCLAAALANMDGERLDTALTAMARKAHWFSLPSTRGIPRQV